MSIVMLILALIPALIAIVNWWKSRKPADPAVLQKAQADYANLNHLLAGRARLGPIEKAFVALLRRHAEKIPEAYKTAPESDDAIGFLNENTALVTHCKRLGIAPAGDDVDLPTLKQAHGI